MRELLTNLDDSSKSVVAALGFILFVPHILWSSYVLMTIWNWHGVPALGLPAIGLGTAVAIDAFATHMAKIGRASLQAESLPGESLVGEVSSAFKGAVCLAIAWAAL